jgi:aryl-alcohol dehydrogenase-like predicted oxidoreductase
MKLRNLGKSGLRVSLVGLGCNNFGQRMDLESATRVIHKALDCGITLFDTADVYGGRGGSESVLGQVLGERRKDIVLASKFAMAMDDGEKKGASRRYIMRAVEASLRRLKTDWLDLYQQHRHDPTTSCGRARCATSATPTSQPRRRSRPSSPRATSISMPSRRARTSIRCSSAASTGKTSA